MSTPEHQFFSLLDPLLAKAQEASDAGTVRALQQLEDIFRRSQRSARDYLFSLYDDLLEAVEEYENPIVSSLTPAQVALATAEEEWLRGVREPAGTSANGTADILRYIKEGLRWNPPKDYKDGTFHWCGAFAAYCYSKAGMHPDLRKFWMPSCNRQYYGHFERGHWPRKDNQSRVTYTDRDGGEILPGDIVMVGDASGKPSGSHITLCHIVREDYIETFEGNAKGKLPGGRIAEGVIRQKRYFKPGGPQGNYIIKWAWRPDPTDFVRD